MTQENKLSSYLDFRNGRSSPSKSDDGRYMIFGSNGVIGRADQCNSDAKTIIIGRVGTYCGSIHFSSEPCWVTDNAIVASAKNPEEARFWYFLLRAYDLNSHRAGSGQPLLNQSILNSIKTNVSDETTRLAIANILGALDDKIELNRRMNETLEAMARAIFKDWFVDFGPTRAKMEGREAYLAPEVWEMFPDSFDDDDKPEGWTEKPLDEVAHFLNGLALQKYPANGCLSLPVIKIAQLRAGSVAPSDRASIEIPREYIVENGDVLFSWSGSLLHRVWTSGRGALNQHLFKVTSNQFPKWFFFHWIAQHMPSFQATAASKATTMGHIQRHHLTQAATVIATPAVMKAADELIEPLFNLQIANDLESHTLAATRDLLLPKLMSGEIRVKDAEAVVAEVT